MKEMTSLERCMAVLDGRMPDTLPVVPQSFMFAVETAGYKIGEVNRNGRKMAEAHKAGARSASADHFEPIARKWLTGRIQTI